MSRPKGIYFILIWFFITFLRQIGPLFQMLENHNLNDVALPPWFDVVFLGLIIFFIIVMVGLFKLEKFSRWIAIIFFVMCTIIPIINLSLSDQNINLKLFIAMAIIFAIPNILAIWYLLSKGFIKKSGDFKREKEKNKIMPNAKGIY
jgi:hypothetical protein